MKFDLENEQLILANVLQFPEFAPKFVKILSPSDFIVEKHETFYLTVKEALESGLKLDDDLIVTLSKKYKVPIEFSFLQELRKFFPNKVSNFEHHLEIQKREAFRYKFLTEEVEKLHLCKSVEDIYKTLSLLRSKILKEFSSQGEVLLDAEKLVEKYESVLRQREDGSVFYSTGYSSLDEELLHGLAPGGVSVVAGRAGMGKSALVANMLYRLSRKNIPVAHFTLEMSDISVLDRIVSLSTFVPLSRLTKHVSSLSEMEKTKVSQKLEELRNNRFLFISDKPRMSLSDIAVQVEKLKEKMNFQHVVVFIDLFGQITDIDPTMMSFSYETHLRETKLYARELGVHFVLVAQIGRRVEQGRSIWRYRPGLDDLKHSGGWEEVADIVFLLFRAKYYDRDLEDDILEINVAKQREGPIFERYFIFEADCSLIVSTELKPYDKRTLKFKRD